MAKLVRPVVKKVTKQPVTGAVVVPSKTKKPAVKPAGKPTRPPVKKPTTKTAASAPAAAPAAANPFAPAAVDDADVEAGAQTKYGPAFASLAAQQRAQDQRAKDIPVWFQAYQNEIAAANKQASDTGAAVQAGMAAFTNALSGNDASTAAGLQQGMAADAAARGGIADPALIGRAIDAGAVRRENNTGLGNLLATNVEATAERGRGSSVNAAAQKVQARVDQSNEQGKLAAKKTELEKDRGDFKVTYKRQLESDAYDAALKAFLTGSQAEAATTNANTKAAAAKTAASKAANTPNQWGYLPAEWKALTPAQRQAIITKQKKAGKTPPRDTSGDVNKWGYTNAEWKAMTPAQRQAIMKKVAADGRAPAKGDKGKSPYLGTSQQNTAKDNVDSTVTAGKALKANYSEAEVRSLLLNGRAAQTIESGGKKVKIPAIPKHDKRWVNVAMDIIYLGGVSQANVKALHDAGIKVGPLGYKVLPKGYKRPAAPPNKFLESVIPGVTGGN